MADQQTNVDCIVDKINDLGIVETAEIIDSVLFSLEAWYRAGGSNEAARDLLHRVYRDLQELN